MQDVQLVGSSEQLLQGDVQGSHAKVDVLAYVPAGQFAEVTQLPLYKKLEVQLLQKVELLQVAQRPVHGRQFVEVGYMPGGQVSTHRLL